MKLKICEFDGCTCVVSDEDVYIDKRMKHEPMKGKIVKYEDEGESGFDMGTNPKRKGEKSHGRQFKMRRDNNRIPKKQRVHRRNEAS